MNRDRAYEGRVGAIAPLLTLSAQRQPRRSLTGVAFTIANLYLRPGEKPQPAGRQGAARFARRYPASSSVATFLCSLCQGEASRSVRNRNESVWPLER